MVNFAKDAIIDVWWGPACASECNSIYFHKKVPAKTILKNGN